MRGFDDEGVWVLRSFLPCVYWHIIRCAHKVSMCTGRLVACFVLPTWNSTETTSGHVTNLHHSTKYCEDKKKKKRAKNQSYTGRSAQYSYTYNYTLLPIQQLYCCLDWMSHSAALISWTGVTFVQHPDSRIQLQLFDSERTFTNFCLLCLFPFVYIIHFKAFREAICCRWPVGDHHSYGHGSSYVDRECNVFESLW